MDRNIIGVLNLILLTILIFITYIVNKSSATYYSEKLESPTLSISIPTVSEWTGEISFPMLPPTEEDFGIRELPIFVTTTGSEKSTTISQIRITAIDSNRSFGFYKAGDKKIEHGFVLGPDNKDEEVKILLDHPWMSLNLNPEEIEEGSMETRCKVEVTHSYGTRDGTVKVTSESSPFTLTWRAIKLEDIAEKLEEMDVIYEIKDEYFPAKLVIESEGGHYEIDETGRRLSVSLEGKAKEKLENAINKILKFR